jgi:toxin ParE1/3/4
LKAVWSPLAIERADEEARFIAGDKPEAALAWLEGLFVSTDRLEAFPDSGRDVPEIGLREYREVIYGKSHRV